MVYSGVGGLGQYIETCIPERVIPVLVNVRWIPNGEVDALYKLYNCLPILLF